MAAWEPYIPPRHRGLHCEARNLLIKGTDVENYKLKTAGNYYGMQFDAHSALENARAKRKLLQIFLKNSSSSP